MNQQAYLSIILTFVCACAVAFACTPLAKKFAFAIGAIDNPGGRHIHKKPTALMGGLAIFAGFVVSLLIFGSMDRQMTSIMIGALIIITISALDDVFDLPAWIRLCVHFLAALFPILIGGIRIERLSALGLGIASDFELGFLSVPITMIWIVGVTNAVNWIDGLDGLAAGVSGIASLSLLVISCILGNPYIALIMAALAGAVVGFIPYNLNPAKIFMGDTGAMFLGYMLGVMSIQGLFKFYVVVSFIVPFLVIGIPILDMLTSTIRRIMHGQSPMASDRSHVHHRLIDIGFTPRQTVAILYCISGILGISAVVMTVSSEIKAILLLLAIVIAALFGIILIAKREQKPESSQHMSEEGPDVPKDTNDEK